MAQTEIVHVEYAGQTTNPNLVDSLVQSAVNNYLAKNNHLYLETDVKILTDSPGRTFIIFVQFLFKRKLTQ